MSVSDLVHLGSEPRLLVLLFLITIINCLGFDFSIDVQVFLLP